jgi:hypothetical protein
MFLTSKCNWNIFEKIVENLGFFPSDNWREGYQKREAHNKQALPFDLGFKSLIWLHTPIVFIGRNIVGWNWCKMVVVVFGVGCSLL